MPIVWSGYTGYKEVDSDNPNLANLYSDKSKNWFDLYENEYLIVRNMDGDVVDRLKWQDGRHKAIYKKPIESMAMGRVSAKNVEQELAIDALMDERTTVKVLSGNFGTGKDVLMTAVALQLIQQNKFEKLLWVRNNVEVKDSNPLGFLPGDKSDKLISFAMPLADHLGGIDALNMYIQQGRIEIEHLGFMRGRDIKNSIVYCSESEHLTRSHVQLLLGRIADGSILFINGDWKQIDAKAFEQDNGLMCAIDRLKGQRLFSYVHLRETVRSETAQLADLLD